MMEKKKDRTSMKILCGVTFLIMIGVNMLANTLPINGKMTGDVTANAQNLFTPAAWVFSIWGLIYFLVACFTLYYIGFFRGGKRYNSSNAFLHIGLLFSISSLGNAIWIFCWHYQKFGLSLVFMLIILASLILINQVTHQMHLGNREKFFLQLPFSVYFGWISVATIANVTTLLVSMGFRGGGISESIWTMVVIVVGMIIGVMTLLKNKDLAYILVFIWAYTGILVKHLSSEGFYGQYIGVIATVIVCIAIFMLSGIHILLKRNGDTGK